MAELTDRRRAVLHALFLDATDSYDMLARRTGLPVGSIGPTRARALAELRVGLARHGYLTA
jgi:DNA-directed RNA polymerase specialized sigma24 family protein